MFRNQEEVHGCMAPMRGSNKEWGDPTLGAPQHEVTPLLKEKRMYTSLANVVSNRRFALALATLFGSSPLQRNPFMVDQHL